LISTSQFFRQTIYFATDIAVGWLDVFLIQNKQKNRKPKPAVGVLYFWFYTGFLVSLLR